MATEGTRAGRAYVEVVPSLKDFHKKVQKDMRDAGVDARRAFDEGFSGKSKAPEAPKPDSAKTRAAGAKSGSDFAGAFDKEVRTKVTAALKSLPDAKITADSSDAEREVAKVRASLERLSSQRIGIDVDEATALNRLETLQRKLAEISASDGAAISVKADTTQAALELDKVRVAAERVGAMSPTIQVDADTTAARAQMAALEGSSVSASAGVSGLVATGLLLGPALVPGAAAATGALFGLAAGGLAAASGIGVVALALSGISDAVKATIAAEDSAAKDAETAAARRVQAARSIEDAQQGVADATQAQADQAVRSAKAVEDAQQGVLDAQRGVADARRSAADGVQAALARVASAEDAQTRAVQDAKNAQDGLNQARKDAKQALADLQDQLRDGSLSQEQAEISLERARLARNKKPKNDIDRRQAELDYKQAKANLSDIKEQNADLAAQKRKADRDGIEGSDGVRAAQQRLIDAQKNQKAAAQDVADAEAGVVKARTEGAQKVAAAQERVAAAQERVSDAMAEQERSSARSATALTRAQLNLTRAQQDAKKATEGTTDAQRKQAEAMAGLSPAGRKFTKFLLGLRSGFKELRDDAATGFLPGLQSGMESAGKALAPFRGIIGSLSKEMGRMASSAGKALGGKEFQGFFSMVEKFGGPTLRQVGSILGNISRAFAGLAVAFQPVASDMLNGLSKLTARFADFSNEGKGGGLQKFIDYVREQGPKVAEMLGSLGGALAKVAEAVAPFGEWVVAAIKDMSDRIKDMPVGQLRLLIGAVAGLTLAWKAATLAARGINSAYSTLNTFKKVATRLTNAESLATVRSTIATKAKTVATKAATVAQKAATLAARIFNAVISNNPIGRIILLLTALGAGLVLLYKKNKTFRDFVNRLWASVKGAISTVVTWFRETALPWMRDALTKIGAAASRLWTNHISPAFTKIKNIAVSVFGWIRNTGLPWVRSAIGAIGKVVAWLWTNVYKRYFTFILGKVKSVFGWIKDKGWPALKVAFQAIGDKAVWLWKKAKGAFDNMRAGIGKVKDAFKTARDGIGRIWSGLTSTISGPINAALGWLDRNFLSKVRSVLNAVGAGDLAKKIPSLRGPISDGAGGNRGGRQMGGSPQFARGGWTGPGSTFQPAGVVHADEFVVKKTSRRRFERNNPGFLDHINRTGRMPGYAIGGKVAGLNKKFYEQLSAFNAAAGGKYSVYSGYRSIAEQQVLYNRYLSGNGPVAARPGGSQHNFGLAADLSPSNARVDADLARRFGLVFTVPSESWHIEPTWGRKGGAGGGVVGGGGGGFLSGLAAKVFDKGKSVLNGIIDKLPKSLGFWGGVGAGAMKMAVPAIFKKFKGAADLMGATSGDGTGGTGSGGGGGVDRWRTMVRKALYMTGQPASLVGRVLMQMQTESGGNPRAINLWDSNAAKGTPSKGLMQVIDPTFREHAMKGYATDIYDPLSNILASIRYAISRYGSLTNAYRGVGYSEGGLVSAAPIKPLLFDSGGYLPPGVSVVSNQTKRPEPLMRLDGSMSGPSVFKLYDVDGDLMGSMRGVAEDVVDGQVGFESRMSRRGV